MGTPRPLGNPSPGHLVSNRAVWLMLYVLSCVDVKATHLAQGRVEKEGVQVLSLSAIHQPSALVNNQLADRNLRDRNTILDYIECKRELGGYRMSGSVHEVFLEDAACSEVL
jgi:hypothetical protein